VIAVSIVGVLVAAGLLVVGLVQDSTLLFYSSIAASVLAASALLVGVRNLPATQLPEDDFDVGRTGPAPGRPAPLAGRANLPRQGAYGVASVQVRAGDPTSPAGAVGDPRDVLESVDVVEVMDGLGDAVPGGDDQPGDPAAAPPDEPAPERVGAARSAAVASLLAEVAVINGRPRYHVTTCLHLLGRDVERLPVMEAIELGFTPCGQCEPVSVLLSGRPET
jgi:hypothetical protein